MELSEEEIMQTLENMIKSWNNIREDCKNSDLSKQIEQIEKENKAIQGLLDLYNKQKEEIERLKNEEEYAILGKETLLDAIHKQQKEIEVLKGHNEELAKFILNSGIEIIKSDKKDMIIDKDNYYKFKIE